MGFTKPIEQYLFCNLLTKIYVFMYLKDIIRGENRGAKRNCFSKEVKIFLEVSRPFLITYFQFRNALFIVLLKYSPPVQAQWLSAFLQKRMPNCQNVPAPASEAYHTEGNAYWCKAPSYCLKSAYLSQMSRPYRRQLIKILTLCKHIRGLLCLRLCDSRHISHFGIKKQIFVIVAWSIFF